MCFCINFVVMAFTDMRDWIKVDIIALSAGIDVYFITKVESKNQQIIAFLTDGALFLLFVYAIFVQHSG